MSLISAHDISKSYGQRQLLERVSLTLEPGDRLGLIGVNGAGKSTLIRILLGLEDADAGEIQKKRDLTFALVTQTPRIDPSWTVGQAVQEGLAHNLDVRRALDALNHALQAARPEEMDGLIARQAALADELERAGGWNIEHRAEAAMQALGVPPATRRLAELSPGEVRRVALCAAVVARPEFLVLDEPTNHIDVAAIEWLEETLAAHPGALLLVTHDRWFLDRVANRHAELDRGELRLYEGNYSEYLAAKAEREAMEARTESKRQRAIESELQWVRRRAPARTTKQRARLDRFDALVAARPKAAHRDATFRLPHPARIGKTILELHDISKGFGGRALIGGLSLILKRGDRIGIVGPNGAGKTTLLRMILGEIEPDFGTVVRGQNTLITYADQRRPLDDDNTVLEEVAGDSDVVHVGDEVISVYGFLEGLLFDGAQQRTKISALSGGERSRVALAKALRETANLLILDEPTNDLDLPTLRVLEDALVDYPGCALIVSHDRYFLDRVTTAILAFGPGGRLVFHEGGYDAYRAAQASPSLRAIGAVPPAVSAGPTGGAKADLAARDRAGEPATTQRPEKPKKRSYREEQEFKGMEARILEAEAKVAELEAELSDGERIRALGAAIKERMSALEEAKGEVDALYARWAELERAG